MTKEVEQCKKEVITPKYKMKPLIAHKKSR